MEPVQIDPLAVLVAAVAHFVLGGLWYSPVLFAKPFMRAVGKTEEELREGSSPLMYVWAFLGGLAKSVGLAVVLGWIGGDLGVAEAAGVGLLIGVLIHGAADAVNAFFEKRDRTLVAISVAYDAVGLAIAGAIIVAMS